MSTNASEGRPCDRNGNLKPARAWWYVGAHLRPPDWLCGYEVLQAHVCQSSALKNGTVAGIASCRMWKSCVRCCCIEPKRKGAALALAPLPHVATHVYIPSTAPTLRRPRCNSWSD